MAIVVQEQPNASSKILRFVTWFVIIAVIGVAVYYIFFKRPELIERAIPSGLEGATELLELKIKPEDVVKGPFERLRPYVPPLELPEGGKANPFSL